MIREFGVKNYKSILDNTVELGRFNVFIGENGCGKTNLLEAMAMAAGAVTDKLDTEELYARGIRVAKPSITRSSFAHAKADEEIRMDFIVTDNNDATKKTVAGVALHTQGADDIYAQWQRYRSSGFTLEEFLDNLQTKAPQRDVKSALKHLALQRALASELAEFAIYNINHLALRGIQSTSKRSPLGINGESLDLLISSFDKKESAELLSRSKVVAWVDKVLLDTEDELKLKGHKLGRSTSLLYFRDKFMRKSNNLFSAENANEGILHVLFYLALFISDKTPGIFGIDNIESALNPQLCRDLIKELAALAQSHNKQALIATHNPAILDGLNLHDDEQRLFVVSRNDEGHTVTERIRVKPSVDGEKFKLSELWMRGHLGGLPTGF
ncbi:MAG: AAA family ATPase [Byssovorax sp.]